MTKKKKLLILTPYIPYPLDSGGKIAQFEINDSIRKHLDITIVFPVSKKESQDFARLKEVWPDIVFEPYVPSLLQRIRLFVLKTINYGFFPRARAFVYHLYLGKKYENDASLMKATQIYKSEIVDPGVISHVLNLISRNTYQIIQVEFHAYLPIIQFLPKQLKTIFIHHEIRFARELTELNTLERSYDFLLKLSERNKIQEIKYLQAYNRVVTLSQDDKTKLAPYLRDENILISPFAIHPVTADQAPFTFNNKLIFIGGQDHLPNADGLRWFITNCWDNLKESIPELEIDVIGKWNPDSVSWCDSRSGISFLGFVEDLQKASQNCISLVPIRIGSGIRMKIIETVNSGIPFITTTIGVEGLNFRNGIDCLIADQPGSFEDGIRKLISEKTLGSKLAEQARITLSKEYSYDRIITQRLSAYSDTTDAPF